MSAGDGQDRNTGNMHDPRQNGVHAVRKINRTNDPSGAGRQPDGNGDRSGQVRRNTGVTTRDSRALDKERRYNNNIIRIRSGMDRPMLVIILVLVALGTLTVFSASYPSALTDYSDGFYYVKKQLVFALLGIILMISISYIPYNFIRKFSPPIYVFGLLLLVLVLFVGKTVGTVAKRWLEVGPLTFQPSEAMKDALILMLGWYFQKYEKKMKTSLGWKGRFFDGVFRPLILVAVPCVLVLLEKHLSGTLIIAAIGFFAMMAGGSNFIATILMYGIGVVGAGAVYLMKNPYAMQRITSFTSETSSEMSDETLQSVNGLRAIGSGGLFGLGIGESRMKINYVPEAQNDFIFSIWCEEMGFVGAVLLIGIYIAFLIRGFSIALRSPDRFSYCVAFGITSHIGIQAFLNLAVVTGLLPNTGVSLPFFSYGGSSLVVLLCEMGILLSISRHTYKTKEEMYLLKKEL